MIPRIPEPEVMDTVDEAVDYDAMDHSSVNRLFVGDLLLFLQSSKQPENSAPHVLDLGTGTALIPIELQKSSDEFQSVLACDLSKEMLKIARSHLSGTPLERSILPVYCDAKRLPMADQSCRVVMSNSIVHHIPEPLDVFREMRRVIHAEGVLFIRDLMRPSSDQEVEQIVQAYAGTENAHQQKMFRESLHAALTIDEVRELLSQSAFPADWVTATSDRHWTIAGQL